jgi:hypothetical protein
MKYEPDDDQLEGSIMSIICADNDVRRETFKEISMYPRKRLLQFDLNFRSTVERALELKTNKPLKMLLDHFFEYVNEIDYYPLIMTDLSMLLEQT